MTVLRVGCSARLLYRDRHLAVGTWYEVRTPDGQEHVFCSGACLLSYAVYGALPADLETRHSETTSGSETAA